MKILVAIKQVPSRDSSLRVNDAGAWIDEPDASEINDPDAYALEEALQLKEKQKMKYIYGVLERQFRNYFEKATHMKGKTGDNLVKLLELRLDNVIYRMGFAPTRRSARQLVTHGHFQINKEKVNIPSFQMKTGDVITVREKSRQLDIIHNAMKRVKDASVYTWVSLDKAGMTGTFLRVPEREEIPMLANEQLVVELYSK